MRPVPSVLWFAPWLAFAAWSVAGCSGSAPPAPPPAPPPAAVAAAPAAATEQPARPAPVEKSPAVKPAAEVAVAPAATPAAESVPVAEQLAALRRTLAATSDKFARVDVIDEIAKFGQQSKDALADLVKATADDDLRVRWHAARAIGLIGEDALSAVPTLVSLLGDADPVVATQAAAAIGLIREDDGRETIPDADARLYTAAVDPLVRSTTHQDPRVRRSALRALGRLLPTPASLAPLLSRQLADADPSVVMPALQSLADMDEAAVPFLLETLKDPKARYWATLALAEIGPEAAPAVGPLARLAAEGETVERIQAFLALASIGEAAREAAPVMAAALESGDSSLWFPAAFALGSVRGAQGDAALAKAAGDKDPFMAAVASWALAKIHPDDAALAADAVKKLRARLKAERPEERSATASGLSDLADKLPEPLRAELAAEFLGLLADDEPAVSRAAGAALIRLGAPSVPSLRRGLAEQGLRERILEVVAGLGETAKPLLDDLVPLLDAADPGVRGEAAAAIAAIGPGAAAAVPKLLATLQAGAAEGGDRQAAYPAAYALGRIGPAARPALETLRSFAASTDEVLATVAVWSTLKIDPSDKSLLDVAIPALRKAARSPRDIVRLEAIVALGELGPDAAPAIPIVELVSEEDSVKDIRTAAAAALRKIKGG